MVKSLKIAVFGSSFPTDKSVAVQRLLELLAMHQAEVWIDQDFNNFLTGECHLDTSPSGLITENDFRADMIISMGGDGTFLKTASKVGNKEIPIVGINMGHLGFLADFAPDEMDTLVNMLFSQTYKVEYRSVLAITLFDSQTQKTVACKDFPYALNEIAILKHDISSMISIEAYIGDTYLTTYQADGLVVSTPTGSTAYNLSVGGPIVEPMSGTIGLTPVAPHSLNVRPVVLRDDSCIRLKVRSRSHNYLIAMDGRSKSYPESIECQIQKADYRVLVVKRENRTFFETLRLKMMWGADNRN